jgi:hypothetical protein
MHACIVTGMTTTCALCETAEAQVLKFETDEREDEDGNPIFDKVALKICLACAHDWYDGTEDHLGTYPLEMALAA